jgi:hypothetical protein
MFKRLFNQKKLIVGFALMCVLVPCFIGASVMGALVNPRDIKEPGNSSPINSVRANDAILAILDNLGVDTANLAAGSLKSLRLGREDSRKPQAHGGQEFKVEYTAEAKNHAFEHLFAPFGNTQTFSHEAMFNMLNRLSSSEERISQILSTFRSTTGGNITASASLFRDDGRPMTRNRNYNAMYQARWGGTPLGPGRQSSAGVHGGPRFVNGQEVQPNISGEDENDLQTLLDEYENNNKQVDIPLITAVIEILSRCGGCHAGPPIVLCGGNVCRVSERNKVLIPLVIEALTEDDEVDMAMLAEEMFKYIESLFNDLSENGIQGESQGTGQNPQNPGPGQNNGFMQELMNMLQNQAANGGVGPGGFNMGNTMGTDPGGRNKIRTDLVQAVDRELGEFKGMVRDIINVPRPGATVSHTPGTITYTYNRTKEWFPSICGAPAIGSQPGGNKDHGHRCVSEDAEKALKELAEKWDLSATGAKKAAQNAELAKIEIGCLNKDNKKCSWLPEGGETSDRHCLVWHILECTNIMHEDTPYEVPQTHLDKIEEAIDACTTNTKRQRLFGEEGIEAKQWQCCQSHESEGVKGWIGKEQGSITITVIYEPIPESSGKFRLVSLEKKCSEKVDGRVLYADKRSDKYADIENKEDDSGWWEYIEYTENMAQIELAYGTLPVGTGQLAASHRPGEYDDYRRYRERQIEEMIAQGLVPDGEVWYFSHGNANGVQAWDIYGDFTVNRQPGHIWIGAGDVLSGGFENYMRTAHGIDIRGATSIVLSTCGQGNANNQFALALLQKYGVQNGGNLQRVYANNRLASIGSTRAGTTGHTYFAGGGRVNGRHPVGCPCNGCP